MRALRFSHLDSGHTKELKLDHGLSGLHECENKQAWMEEAVKFGVGPDPESYWIHTGKELMETPTFLHLDLRSHPGQGSASVSYSARIVPGRRGLLEPRATNLAERGENPRTQRHAQMHPFVHQTLIRTSVIMPSFRVTATPSPTLYRHPAHISTSRVTINLKNLHLLHSQKSSLKDSSAASGQEQRETPDRARA